MSRLFSFRHIEPIFYAGLLDDPLLLVRIRPTGRFLLFDCGQVHHLAKRNFTHLDAIFISHAHMDHWMGIDSVIRHLIASARTIDLFGPAGLADKLEYKLRGYDWNLVEDFWCSFQVHEIEAKRILKTFFCGPQGFERRPLGEEPRAADDSIYRTPFCRVHAQICKHDIDSIIYRIDEQPAFLIDKERLRDAAPDPGAWLGALKKYFFSPERYRPAGCCPEGEALIEQLLVRQRPPKLGYISDIGFTHGNLAKILPFMSDLELLFSECTYLGRDELRARDAGHLCTRDVNRLLEELMPRFFVPMHLSRSYRSCVTELFSELSPPPQTRVLPLPLLQTPRPLRADETVWAQLAQGRGEH
jgi:ribonuclease Z